MKRFLKGLLLLGIAAALTACGANLKQHLLW